MPGSMNLKVIDGGSPNSTYKSSPTPKSSPFYQQKDFRTEKLSALKGMMSNRRANRVLNRYMKSEAGQQAEEAFARAEGKKYMASVDAFLEAGKQKREGMHQAALQKINASLSSRVPVTKAPDPVPDLQQKVPLPIPKQIDWNAKAQQYGFADMAAVKQWQQQNGLTADGKFGNQSIAKWQALRQKSQPELQQRQSAAIQPKQSQPVAQQTTVEQPASYTTKAFTLQDFNNHKNFRDPYHEFKTITVDGKTYPIRVTTGLYGRSDIENDHSYAFDEETGMIRKVGEYLAGTPTGKFAEGSQWVHPRFFYEDQWLQQHPAPAKQGPLGGEITPEYKKWFSEVYEPAYKAEFRKQGGIMNRINYFQQGGAAPQQDIKAQITALVQAAMQGDQKATQQVNQIMEAAKAGNQQAVQLAQLITEVAKQLQGQATSAKWGSKLDYIKSLKFAKGGKTCPVCDKKVEMKACGGKKAKKRYFGGII